MASKQKSIPVQLKKAALNDFTGEAIFNVDDDILNDCLGVVKKGLLITSSVFLSVDNLPKGHWIFVDTKLKLERLPYSEIEIVNYQDFLGGGFRAYISESLMKIQHKVVIPDDKLNCRNMSASLIFTNKVNGRDGILIATQGATGKDERNAVAQVVIMMIEMIKKVLDLINNPTIIEVDTVKRAANLMINPQHKDFKKLSKSTILHTVRRKAAANEDGEKRNGTEKSPHLRRGHLRTYKSGKTAWVKSSSVKNHDGAAKLYAVKK